MEANKKDVSPIIAYAEEKADPRTHTHKCIFYGTFAETQTDAKALEIMKTRELVRMSDNGLVYFFK